MHFQLSEINIYPIKSLGGISVKSAIALDKGFENDRRWMLIDQNNKFLSQRTIHKMALFKVSILQDALEVRHQNQSIQIPFSAGGKDINVQIWDDICIGRQVDENIDQWFSDEMGIKCSLVKMPANSDRLVDQNYAKSNEVVSFADGYPYLIVGESSLIDLNSKLETSIPMNRFRPNLVFKGGAAFVEDSWKDFSIGETKFKAVKPCARCVLTTIDQETGIAGKEPLATLSKYRRVEQKVLFGQNLVCVQGGEVNVGEFISF